MTNHTDPDYRAQVEQERLEEYEERQRMREWARNHYRHPHDPDRVAPEAFCPTCNGYTTNITIRGECGDCGTGVREYAE